METMKRLLISILTIMILVNAVIINTYATEDNGEMPSSETASTESVLEYDFKIEQVEAELPYINVYCYPDKDKQKYELSLGDDSESIFQTVEESEAIHYYILLDNSGTMTRYFDGIKQYLETTFVENKDDNDLLTLHLIGEIDNKEDWNPIIEAEKDKNIIKNKIHDLTCTGQKTYLNSAIYNAAQKASEEKQSVQERQVLLVISDCYDESTTPGVEGYRIETVEEQLNKTGVPLYLLALDTGNNQDDITAMTDVAEAYGGIAETVIEKNSNLDEQFSKIVHYITNVQKLTFISDAQTGKKEIAVTNESKKNSTKQVSLDKYHSDFNEINNNVKVKVEKTEANKLCITFDKKMQGIDKKDNYDISYEPAEGQDYDYFVNNIKLLETNSVDTINQKTKVELELSNTIYNGSITISFGDAIKTVYGAESSPASVVQQIEGEEQPSQIIEWLKKYGWIIVAFIVSFILIFVIVFVMVKKLKKKGGVVYVENQAVLTDNVIQKQHVHIEKGKDLMLKLVISGGGKDSVEINAVLKSSLIVGRSDLSDVFIDDSMMSRQHFVITEENGSIFIQDLETTNGTMLNGVRLKGKQPLSQEDVISAGSLQIRVYW